MDGDDQNKQPLPLPPKKPSRNKTNQKNTKIRLSDSTQDLNLDT